jgi:hypothetical protein
VIRRSILPGGRGRPLVQRLPAVREPALFYSRRSAAVFHSGGGTRAGELAVFVRVHRWSRRPFFSDPSAVAIRRGMGRPASLPAVCPYPRSWGTPAAFFAMR